MQRVCDLRETTGPAGEVAIFGPGAQQSLQVTSKKLTPDKVGRHLFSESPTKLKDKREMLLR